MKKRILHITSTRYGIGGVEKLLLDMADKYDFSEFEVEYCNLFDNKKGRGVFPTALRQRGLKYHDVKFYSWYQVPQMVFKVANLIKKEKFDIVHTHMLKATIVGQMAAKMAGTAKKVLTRHYTADLVTHNSVIKSADRRLTRAADGIISISDAVRADMLNEGVSASKITIVYNGIDLKPFENVEVKPIDSGEFVIGTVGSLTARKGQRHLIKAMPAVLSKHSGARLVIIGEGPEKNSLETLITELGLKDKVTLMGFQKDVASALSKLDLYVHPSVSEPFGIAVLEAMAARKCVIATGVDGVLEIVSDGKNGILVPPKDPASLAAAICGLIEAPAKMAELVENARKKVEEDFSIEKTVSEYQIFYKDILSSQK